MTPQVLSNDDKASRPLQVRASRNVICGNNIMRFKQYQGGTGSADEALRALETFALRLLNWQGESNAYTSAAGVQLMYVSGLHSISKTRAEWLEAWNATDTNAQEGEIRLQGGELYTRALARPHDLSAADFRLRPDSAGYRAGPDGKDLGADVELVGPGPAYERWKQTPEYQQWLTESGQVPEGAAATVTAPLPPENSTDN